ncbi:MAG: hypothetical protein M3Q23_10630 [Actinomycetota bacterium]|nr:hypothetical protein [Actinomycetota bacterium]
MALEAFRTDLAAAAPHLYEVQEALLPVGFDLSLVQLRTLDDYYATLLGARSPHSGGFFLKLLTNLDELHVHFAACEDPVFAEDAMLRGFCAGVSPETLAGLLDPAHPFPFANLEWPLGVRKAHGIRGARAPRARGSRPAVEEPSLRPGTEAPPPGRPSRGETGGGLVPRRRDLATS